MNGQFNTLRTVSAADLLLSPPQPRALILAPWLRERDAVLLWAPTGAGKSQVAMSMALAVAGGVKVMGWQAEASRSVLYVDGEMDRGDLVERLDLLRKTTHPPLAVGELGRLHFLARDCHSPEVEFPDLGDTDAGHRIVLEAAKTTGATLVILDNLSTLATIEDENSASAIRGPMALVQKLRQMGCTPLVVHHSDKGGRNYRGSSNIGTTFSHIVGLTPSEGAEPGCMDVTMQWSKNRNGPAFAQAPMRVRLVSDDSAPRWEVGESESHQAAQLARAIKSGRFTNLVEAGEALGLKKSRAYELRTAMINEGLMDRRAIDQCFAEARELVAEVDAAQDF